MSAASDNSVLDEGTLAQACQGASPGGATAAAQEGSAQEGTTRESRQTVCKPSPVGLSRHGDKPVCSTELVKVVQS